MRDEKRVTLRWGKQTLVFRSDNNRPLVAVAVADGYEVSLLRKAGWWEARCWFHTGRGGPEENNPQGALDDLLMRMRAYVVKLKVVVERSE